jgi:hypothetical protein
MWQWAFYRGIEMEQSVTKPSWELHYDKAGTLDGGQDAVIDQITSCGITDLFVMSHGWDNSETNAQKLYGTMFPLIETAAAGAGLGAIGFGGIYWPSIWFPDPLPPATDGPQATERAAPQITGAEMAAAMQPLFSSPDDSVSLTAMGRLIDDGIAGLGSDSELVQRQRLEKFRNHSRGGDGFPRVSGRRTVGTNLVVHQTVGCHTGFQRSRRPGCCNKS